MATQIIGYDDSGPVYGEVDSFADPWSSDTPTGWDPSNYEAIFRKWSKPNNTDVSQSLLDYNNQYGVDHQAGLNALWELNRSMGNPYASGATPVAYQQGYFDRTGGHVGWTPDRQALAHQQDADILASQQQGGDDFGGLGILAGVLGTAIGMPYLGTALNFMTTGKVSPLSLLSMGANLGGGFDAGSFGGEGLSSDFPLMDAGVGGGGYPTVDVFGENGPAYGEADKGPFNFDQAEHFDGWPETPAPRMVGPEQAPAPVEDRVPVPTRTGGTSGGGDIWDTMKPKNLSDWLKLGTMGVGAIGALGSAAFAKKNAAAAAAQREKNAQAASARQAVIDNPGTGQYGFSSPAPLNRQFQLPQTALLRYGLQKDSAANRQFYDQVNPQRAAKGGLSQAGGRRAPVVVDGASGELVPGAGHGQQDDVPAMLSSGEYVVDADVVAALGDGSTEAGAKVLDTLRQNVRQHKRSASKKTVPPKAKPLHKYLGGKA